jgi:hypothetical protein
MEHLRSRHEDLGSSQITDERKEERKGIFFFFLFGGLGV